jgi:hypothetical protein
LEEEEEEEEERRRRKKKVLATFVELQRCLAAPLLIICEVGNKVANFSSME